MFGENIATFLLENYWLCLNLFMWSVTNVLLTGVKFYWYRWASRYIFILTSLGICYQNSDGFFRNISLSCEKISWIKTPVADVTCNFSFWKNIWFGCHCEFAKSGLMYKCIYISLWMWPKFSGVSAEMCFLHKFGSSVLSWGMRSVKMSHGGRCELPGIGKGRSNTLMHNFVCLLVSSRLIALTDCVWWATSWPLEDVLLLLFVSPPVVVLTVCTIFRLRLKCIN